MQVILIAAVSADGCIAERADQTSLDWTSKEDTKFFIELTRRIGVVVMGARTFGTINKPLKGRRLIVLSRQQVGDRRNDDLPGGTEATSPQAKRQALSPVGHLAPEGTVEYANMSPAQLVKELATQGHDAVVVAGGSSVYSQFLREGLVTEMYLTVEPVLFGEGVPLASGIGRIGLRLIEARPLGEHSVLLHYRI
ncbi:dihydrofolate reductase [Candidatus Parcubacteria bacterium]|nr:dihydrofolate reductase [Candidatus Parcubacteria bacterium]